MANPTNTNVDDVNGLYNALMSEIEPELTTDILPDLELLYFNETKENRRSRYAWYAIALEAFAERYGNFVHACKEYLEKINQRLSTMIVQKETVTDALHISSIEHFLDEA